jgi:hypothetical protein
MAQGTRSIGGKLFTVRTPTVLCLSRGGGQMPWLGQLTVLDLTVSLVPRHVPCRIVKLCFEPRESLCVRKQSYVCDLESTLAEALPVV